MSIEGDNLLVICSIKGSWYAPWKLREIIFDIKILLHQLSTGKSNIYIGNTNRATNLITNVGHLISFIMFVNPRNSFQLLSILDSVNLRITLKRKASLCTLSYPSK